MIEFLIGAVVGALLMAAVDRLRKRRPRQRKVDENWYGHPRPPIATLRERLPDPPQNHVWEVKVQHAKDGNPFLHLTLVNILTGANVAATKADLVRGGYPWDTWAAYYRNWSSAGPRLLAFDNKIIGPITDWAVGQVNKVAHANASGGYSMGDLS